MLMMDQSESVYMFKEGKFKTQSKKNEKGKIPHQSDIKKESKCFFCKKKGHVEKDCVKYQNRLEKKGNPFSFVCYECVNTRLSASIHGYYRTEVHWESSSWSKVRDTVSVCVRVMDMKRGLLSRHLRMPSWIASCMSVLSLR